MTSHDDIAALRKRLAKTESDRDTWRAAGPEEKYLAAYFAVEALELQLDISVETLNGTVMLSGFAKSGAERTTAENLTRKVEGVKSLVASTSLLSTKRALTAVVMAVSSTRRPRSPVRA